MAATPRNDSYVNTPLITNFTFPFDNIRNHQDINSQTRTFKGAATECLIIKSTAKQNANQNREAAAQEFLRVQSSSLTTSRWAIKENVTEDVNIKCRKHEKTK